MVSLCFLGIRRGIDWHLYVGMVSRLCEWQCVWQYVCEHMCGQVRVTVCTNGKTCVYYRKFVFYHLNFHCWSADARVTSEVIPCLWGGAAQQRDVCGGGSSAVQGHQPKGGSECGARGHDARACTGAAPIRVNLVA
jgi:hypothetical protein